MCIFHFKDASSFYYRVNRLKISLATGGLIPVYGNRSAQPGFSVLLNMRPIELYSNRSANQRVGRLQRRRLNALLKPTTDMRELKHHAVS